MLHFKAMTKEQNPNWNSPEARRLRLLRQAEGYGPSQQAAFAKRLGWSQSEMSMYENGERRVPRGKVLEMHKTIPGFAPLWFTEDRREGLSFDLRRRIEDIEAKEQASADEDRAAS